MEVYRLAQARYAKDLTGKGAAAKGARWNSPGVELLYTAQNRSLAMAEIAVHFTLATLPDDYRMITLKVPDTIPYQRLSEADLPANWKDFPHPPATQKVGNEFVRQNQYAVLFIPSAVTQGEYSVLLNPHHRDFAQIKICNIEKFPFDKRIFT